jgi:hypothetical protein
MSGLLQRLIQVAALLGSVAVMAASGTLTAPAEAPAGSSIEVRWSDSSSAGDFISIDRPGDNDSVYGPNYGYPANTNPVVLTVPTEPGEYLIRFHKAQDYTVVATMPLRITAVTATLDLPASVDAGAQVPIRWTGPNNPADFISIDAVGAPDREYGPYAYPQTGNTVTIQAPEEPGDYEARYHQAGSYAVIGRAALHVGGVTASLTAPASVAAGSVIPVEWTGPNGPQDYISIDPAGAPDRTYGAYAYTSTGTPVSIRAPDEAGDYLLRYHTGQSYKVLASRSITLQPVTASLTAPATVMAGHVFEVAWQGPNNEGDFITLVPVAAGARDYGSNNGYPKRGNPLRMEAVRDPGEYELRYLTGQSYALLARAPVTITPDDTLGRLHVIAAVDATSTPGFGTIEFVLDASGSMLKRLGNERRIDLAKRALVELAREIPAGTGFALRVFGHKEADSCRTDLEIPLAPLDVASATTRIGAIQSMNLAKTPIGDSLLNVKGDLAGATGPALVVLVTDGEETCGGDPQAAIDALRAAGLDVRVNIIGFAVDELALKEAFQAWAQAGGGGYFDAQSGAELSAAVRAALRPAFEVLDGERVVATGTVGADAIELAPGTYRVRVLGAPARDATSVTIEPDTLREISL